MSGIGSVSGVGANTQVAALKAANNAAAKVKTQAAEEQAESPAQEASEHESGSGGLNVLA